jgi:hypothetical protein
MHFLHAIYYELTASTCFEHYLLIFRGRFINNIWYIACAVCRLAARRRLLTPWSRVLVVKLTGLQIVKKFPAFYGTRRFITEFTSAPPTFLYPEPAQSRPYPTSNFLKIRRNIILPSAPGSPRWSPSLRFSHQNPVHVSLLPYTRYVPCPSHYSRLYYLHNIGWGVHAIKIFIMRRYIQQMYIGLIFWLKCVTRNVRKSSKYSPFLKRMQLTCTAWLIGYWTHTTEGRLSLSQTTARSTANSIVINHKFEGKGSAISEHVSWFE